MDIPAKVVVISGSHIDNDWLNEIVDGITTTSDVNYKFRVAKYNASAHKQPDEVKKILDMYNPQKQVIYVTIAGMSNALSGFVAGNTAHTVIACPPLRTTADYMVDIHSSLRMPSGVPVLTILSTNNCVLAVNRILKSWE